MNAFDFPERSVHKQHVQFSLEIEFTVFQRLPLHSTRGMCESLCATVVSERFSAKQKTNRLQHVFFERQPTWIAYVLPLINQTLTKLTARYFFCTPMELTAFQDFFGAG